MFQSISTLSLFLIVLCSNVTFAAVDTASTGLWGTAGTWSDNAVPVNGDTLYIPGGVTVTVDADQGTYSNMILAIQGVLHLAKNDHLEMDANSLVLIGTGGNLSANNGNSKLIIGGNTVHKGTSPTNPIVGPSICNPNGCGLPASSPTSIYDQWPLGVSLEDFQVTHTDYGVLVTWSTLTEDNNDYFQIERLNKYLYEDWVSLTTVDGAGDSRERREYSYLDREVSPGWSYYRLSQTDFDGQQEIFELKSVLVEEYQRELRYKCYQKDSKYVIEGKNPISGSVSIFNRSGSLLSSGEFDGVNSAQIDVSEMPSGIYVLQFEVNRELESRIIYVNSH